MAWAQPAAAAVAWARARSGSWPVAGQQASSASPANLSTSPPVPPISSSSGSKAPSSSPRSASAPPWPRRARRSVMAVNPEMSASSSAPAVRSAWGRPAPSGASASRRSSRSGRKLARAALSAATAIGSPSTGGARHGRPETGYAGSGGVEAQAAVGAAGQVGGELVAGDEAERDGRVGGQPFGAVGGDEPLADAAAREHVGAGDPLRAGRPVDADVAPGSRLLGADLGGSGQVAGGGQVDRHRRDLLGAVGVEDDAGEPAARLDVVERPAGRGDLDAGHQGGL